MQRSYIRYCGAAAVGSILLAASSVSAQNSSALDRELLADAGARVSFQGGGTAGHDGKFFLASADGSMRLWIGGMTQFRYTINNRDTTAPDEDLTTGFDFSRTKLYIGGKVRNDTTFFIRTGFNPSTGTAGLEWAKMMHKLDNGMVITWGQFVTPFLKEQQISEQKFMSTERSAMHETFSDKFSQGVMLTYTSDDWQLFGSITDGGRTQNTAYFSTREADVALTARAEYKFGDAPWKAYKSFTSFRNTATGGMVGGAICWETRGETANTDSFGGTALVDSDIFSYTVDAMYKGGGWSLYGAFLGRTTDAGAGSDFTDFGALVQGSVYVHEQWEIFARWDAIMPDDDRASGEDFNTATFGANHYFFPGSHVAKLTTELAWYLDDQASSSSLVKAPNTRTNLLPSGEENQWALRIQMQLVF